MQNNSWSCYIYQVLSKIHPWELLYKGAAVFAEGLSGAVASGLGKVRYLN